MQAGVITDLDQVSSTADRATLRGYYLASVSEQFLSWTAFTSKRF